MINSDNSGDATIMLGILTIISGLLSVTPISYIAYILGAVIIIYGLMKVTYDNRGE